MCPTVTCVVGTRPEAVKMAPVILRLRRERSRIACRVVATGQHRGLLDAALADLGLCPDLDLNLMRPGQGLPELTARALTALAGVFSDMRPGLVLAQGDTTTVLATSLAAFYSRVPFGHVEAGLRTRQPLAPFPEEKNRVLAGHLAAIHFAPTDWARRNLLREGIDPAAVLVTGNPGIDALHQVVRDGLKAPVRPPTDRYLLVTAHRRELLGPPLVRVVAALRDLVGRIPDLSLVIPVHPNPEAGGPFREGLEGVDRVRLIDPVAYPEFVALMRGATAILTDSGGVQEEAPSLGTPVLVLRDETERPEAIESGASVLVGTDPAAIVAAVDRVWSSEPRPPRQSLRLSPFGDGWASERITRGVLRFFGLDPGPEPEGMPAWPPDEVPSG